ncbi:hypothetical protein [Sinisalibacter lacisalsi]|uniref:Transposase n=1 Tax=Sinisalibacter lacisalsi TaxID=1526570 RepID=A0ABQ1QT00_9RHOB|nr:hypothetical protein [Sinisalibacter lacisalsi]GGD42153.1 hypothetical protein GCM10011358_27550 [Sinisalibacter lacisalsi]
MGRQLRHQVALIESISRNTADLLHRYLEDFAEGTHRLIWADDRAYIEVDRGTDADLIRRQFPTLVGDRARFTGANFPW